MSLLNKIQVELNAPKNQYNGFGKYKYRSLEDIFEGLKPLLKKYECSVIVRDEMVLLEDRFYVKSTAELRDKDNNIVAIGNGFAREEETRKGMDASQITGATSSYARKYAMNGLFAIDDVKDADSMNNKVEKTTKSEDPEVLRKRELWNLFSNDLKSRGIDVDTFLEFNKVKKSDKNNLIIFVEKYITSEELRTNLLNSFSN